MQNSDSIIGAFSEAATLGVPHRFTLIRSLDDGTAIPPEALSDDHSLGVYRDVAPRKMREHLDGYERIEISDLLPKSTLEMGATGSRHEWFLEYAPLRGVQFRAEQLQYLEECWAATLSEGSIPLRRCWPSRISCTRCPDQHSSTSTPRFPCHCGFGPTRWVLLRSAYRSPCRRERGIECVQPTSIPSASWSTHDHGLPRLAHTSTWCQALHE